MRVRQRSAVGPQPKVPRGNNRRVCGSKALGKKQLTAVAIARTRWVARAVSKSYVPRAGEWNSPATVRRSPLNRTSNELHVHVVILRHPTSGPKNLTVPWARTIRPRSQRRYHGMRRDAFAPEVAVLSMTPWFMSATGTRRACYPKLSTEHESSLDDFRLFVAGEFDSPASRATEHPDYDRTLAGWRTSLFLSPP
jgi:hypothetical protein